MEESADLGSASLLAIKLWRRRLAQHKIYYQLELVRGGQAERRTAEERLATIRDEEELIAEVIRTCTARLASAARLASVPGSPAMFGGEGLREILIIHFADTEGVVVGREAVVALMRAGYFSNRGGADGAVYTTLTKLPFHKIKRGVYRVPTDSPLWRRLRGKLAYN